MTKPFYEQKISDIKIDLDLSDRPFKGDQVNIKRLVEILSKNFIEQTREQWESRAEFQPAGEWQDYNKEKSFFYKPLVEGDYESAAEHLANFWRNKLGLIVKEYGKFENLQSGDPDVLTYFKRSLARNFVIWRDIFGMLPSALSTPSNVGNPWGVRIDNEFVTPKAIRFHTNTMQIKYLLQNCSDDTVAEIGGGYGGLALYLSKEVKGLKYFNFDLPETLVLASYYLTLSLPDKRVFLYRGEEITSDLLNAHDIFLFPNYLIDKLPAKSVSVFFNSFSLSEMPPATNKAYLDEIGRITKSFFFHNNMDRKGVINRGFERIPASNYPIDPKKFLLLSTNYDLFHGHFGDYKEFLYAVK